MSTSFMQWIDQVVWVVQLRGFGGCSLTIKPSKTCIADTDVVLKCPRLFWMSSAILQVGLNVK